MTVSYALATFSADGFERAVGLVIDNAIVPLSEVAAAGEPRAERMSAASMLTMLDQWDAYLPLLNDLAQQATNLQDIRRFPIDQARFHPPVDLPRQVFCTGANYRTHVVQITMDMKIGPEGLRGEALHNWAEKMNEERAANGDPYVFTKPTSAIAGANDPLVVPSTTEQLDWEIELGVIIGKGGARIPRETALAHVAGYAIVNDITARDLIPRTDYRMLGTDWLRSKGQIGFLPFGPYLVPAQFIADPQALAMTLTVNDQVMQDESTADMIFDVARQIEYISRYTRLLPGDLICTGSPAGNGTHYDRFLWPGDVMIAEIDGLGVQRVHCMAEK